MVLRTLVEGPATVLEIGSGTGQHAVHFAAALPAVTWLTSDRAENHPGIQAWLDAAGLANARPPLDLDVDRWPWPVPTAVDGAFSANTAHIMHWDSVCRMLAGVGRVLRPGGWFALYGPFNVDGAWTSPGNREFDLGLRAADPGMGIRDLEALTEAAGRAGLVLERTVEMPASNLTLIWRASRSEGGGCSS